MEASAELGLCTKWLVEALALASRSASGGRRTFGLQTCIGVAWLGRRNTQRFIINIYIYNIDIPLGQR